MKRWALHTGQCILSWLLLLISYVLPQFLLLWVKWYKHNQGTVNDNWVRFLLWTGAIALGKCQLSFPLCKTAIMRINNRVAAQLRKTKSQNVTVEIGWQKKPKTTKLSVEGPRISNNTACSRRSREGIFGQRTVPGKAIAWTQPSFHLLPSKYTAEGWEKQTFILDFSPC